MFKIFKKYKRFEHLFLSKVFEPKTLRSLKTIAVAVDTIKAFEKVKNNTHSSTDKKILNFLDEYRVELSNNENKINFKEIGNNKTSSVAEISLKAASSKKWTCFFYELSKIKNINNILEIGTNLGVSGQYFLKGLDEKKKSNFITIEGVKKLCDIATERFNRIDNKKRFKVIHGLYDEKLLEFKKSNIKFDLVFIDGNHRFDATIKYFELLKKQFAQNAIVVFDDIHWSSEMTNAWRRIMKDDSVYLSIDFFKLGIIIFNSKQKSNCFKKYNLFLSH